MSDRAQEIERQVREFLKRASPGQADAIDKLEPTTRIWQVVDSLSILDLVETLEAEFKITIEDLDVIPENFRTLQSVVRFVMERTTPAP
jgi:acyl carrier protein